MSFIPVVVEAEAESGSDLEVLGGPIRARSRLLNLDTERLRASFGQLSEGISHVLQDIKKVGDFHLKEVEVQVEITSEGGVNLVGSLKAGIKGAIKLTFADSTSGSE